VHFSPPGTLLAGMTIEQTPSDDLEHQLARERARNAGLERGLTALNERLVELREENAALRQALDERNGTAAVA
jgi:predicted  nucleic acid-binding Zn-ribbon protein